MIMSSILVLEDDEGLRETVVDLLEDHSLSAMGVENAQEALKASSEYRFDIVISDIRMAGSMDGLGALEVLKSSRPDLKCIVMTGFADDGSPERALRIEVDDYLYKPFRLMTLFKSVEKIRRGKDDFQHYQGLLHDLWKSHRFKEATAELNRARFSCLNTFLVALRSRLINRETALVHWDKIEAAEVAYHQLLRMDKLESDKYQSRCQEYQGIQEGLLRHSARKTIVYSDKRSPGAVDRNSFRNLVERIERGLVSTEQLHMATLVRVSPSVRASNPELQQLYSRMWTQEELPGEVAD